MAKSELTSITCKGDGSAIGVGFGGAHADNKIIKASSKNRFIEQTLTRARVASKQI